MRVVVLTEYRFMQTPDGQVWTQSVFPYSFWTRYLDVFSRVQVLARILKVPNRPNQGVRADGERVGFTAIPYYVGPLQYVIRAQRVQSVINRAVLWSDAVVIRVPSQMGASLAKVLAAKGQPYGLEVVGDPFDVFAPGGVKHPLRPFFRWMATRQLKRTVRNAAVVGYVTARTLQQRYPAREGAFTTYYSSIELPPSAMVASPRVIGDHQAQFRILSVGSLEQLYKGPDVLIDAVAQCLGEGLDLELVFVGDGRHRSQLEARSRAAGLGERCSFLGQLPGGSAVMREMDRADLFVLPSRTEGLPRAMIEAMARGLPCIGSTAGGIPELLPPGDMVPPGDVSALATKIKEVLADPRRMCDMADRNLERAKRYENGVLRRRRAELYGRLRDLSGAREPQAQRN